MDLRTKQQPLKQQYRDEPTDALKDRLDPPGVSHILGHYFVV